jgi:hypothetical protein
MNAGFLRFERVKRWAENQNLSPDHIRHCHFVSKEFSRRPYTSLGLGVIPP